MKLKPGYLVEDYSGQIIPIKYTEIKYKHYGDIEERFLYTDVDGCFLEPLRKHDSNKIFDNLEEAEKHSLIVKKDTIKYYEKRIKEYSDRIFKIKQT